VVLVDPQQTVEDPILTVEALSARSIYIRIDKQKISQVVRNLLSNALKFTPKGGKITIKATVILDPRCERHADSPLSARSQDSCQHCSLSPPYFRFEVIDTGPGISAVSLASHSV